MAGSFFIPAQMFRPVGAGVSLPSYGDKGSTNFKGSILAFADTANRDEAHCSTLMVPDEFPATPASVTVTVEWTSATTTGNFQADFDYLLVGGNDTTSMNQAATQALTVSDVAPSVAHRKLDAVMTATASNWNSAAGKMLQCLLARDGPTEGGGGIANDVLVFGVKIAWT